MLKRLILITLSIFMLVGCSNIQNNNSNIITQEHLDDRIEQEIKTIGDILFYIHKLKDEDFTSTYGGDHLYIWYTAAEELGKIGKPAIPYLIRNLQTKNDYEMALTLYALLLSSQDENVKEVTNGKYIEVNLEFNPEKHENYKKIALIGGKNTNIIGNRYRVQRTISI